MEQVSKALIPLLQNELQTTDERSKRRLPSEEFAQLAMIFDQMQKRYPQQDLTESTEGYLFDLEQLCLKYSLPKVRKALASLRIKPGQKFFPRPDEVAEEIEYRREAGLYAMNQKEWEETQRRNAEHAREEFEKYGDWRARWLASGLSLKDFCAQDDADRENGTGFYANR